MKTIQDHRKESVLNKVFRYEEGMISRREWLNMWRVKGATVEEKEVPKIEFNRTKYNRMTGDEQIKYEQKLKEKKPGYRLNVPDSSTFYEITKIEYEYFKNMELAEDKATEANELSEKIEAGMATDTEIEDAMQKEFDFAAKYFK